MSAVDTIVNEVSNEIHALPTGPFGEVILDPKLLSGLPPCEAYLHPEPDVLVREGPVHISDIGPMMERERLLGVYVPMQSPGRILLSRRNHRDFFWSLVGRLHAALPYLTPTDLERSLRLVVTDTYEHELFHFHSDVLRQLFGGPFDPLLEEALAVAWSRLRILEQRGQWNSQIGRMNGVVFNRLLPMVYDFGSPGYRDWPLYADEVRFKPALLDYLAPPNRAGLESNGVDMEALVFGMLGRISGGLVEAVV